MIETDDPLLQGPVLPPPDAQINLQDQQSADEPSLAAGAPPRAPAPPDCCASILEYGAKP